MTTRHLIAHRDLSLLCDVASDEHIYSRRKLVAVLSCEYLNINDSTSLAVRYLKRIISNFSSLFAEDSSQKSFFCCQLSFTLRCYLTNKYISRANLCAYSDDTVLVQILKSVLTNVRDISCDLLRSELCISGFCLILFNMDRSVLILLYKVFVQKNGVLVVVTFPSHEADKSVLTK